MLCCRSLCFVVHQRGKKKESAWCLKMRTTCFRSRLYECFSLCPIINHFRSAHTFIFFCSGSTHRPLVLTHLSLPQMQPFFHYPSVTGVRSRWAARLLSRSCVPWRRAPNKIWVRLKNPNFFLCVCLSHTCLQGACCHSWFPFGCLWSVFFCSRLGLDGLEFRTPFRPGGFIGIFFWKTCPQNCI